MQLYDVEPCFWGKALINQYYYTYLCLLIIFSNLQSAMSRSDKDITYELSKISKNGDAIDVEKHTIGSTGMSNSTTTTNAQSRKWMLFSLSLVIVSTLGGLIYAFPTLRSNLLEEEESELSETQLGLIFTMASWGNLSAGFVIGILRDELGTRRAVMMCMLFAICGTVGAAFCSADSTWQLCISLVLVELGSGAQVCVLPVAELFEHSGVVLGVLTGVFNVSALIFPLLFNFISKDRRVAFGAYGIFVGILAILSYAMLPQGLSFHMQSTYKDTPSLSEKSSILLSQNDKENDSEEDGNKNFECEGSVANIGTEDFLPTSEQDTNNDDSKVSALEQMRSIEYVALLLWFNVSIVSLQYYAGSIGFHLVNKGDDSGKYETFFPILYAASAVFAPLIGLLSEYIGLGFTQATATILIATSFILLVLDDLVPTQIVGMVCNVFGRLITFAMFYGNIGARFGYDNIGVLLGVGTIIAALVSLIQYPIIDAATSGSAFSVNVVSGVIVIIGLPYCIWLGIKEASERKGVRSRAINVDIRNASCMPLAGSIIVVQNVNYKSMTYNGRRGIIAPYSISNFMSMLSYSSIVAESKIVEDVQDD